MMLGSIFNNTFSRAAIFSVLAAGLIGLFVVTSLNGESNICHGAEYGDYDTDNGICQVDGEYASNVIIVTGNTANSPTPNFKDKTIAYNYLKNSIAKNANIKIVSAATDLAIESVEVSRNETNDAHGFIESVNKVIQNINTQISQAPTSDGVTYLEAINKAGRDAASALAMAPSGGKDDGATIIVIGSGLSDGGILNFTTNSLINKTATEVLKAMESASQLTKNLNNIKIIWSGIGQVVAPQDNLPEDKVDSLKDTYERILLAKGAKTVIFDDTMRGSESVRNNTYKVKTVSIASNQLPFFEFSDSELSFKGDSDEFLDKKQASNALTDVVDTYSKSAGNISSISVTGYISPTSCAGNDDISLSVQRANTVKKYLVEHGIPDGVIIAKGGGVYAPEDSICDKNGNLDRVKMQSKRKVIIEFK